MSAPRDNPAVFGESNSQDLGRKPGRKPRAALSCGQCRYRKLKCDRQQPCQNCVVRKDPGACIYSGETRPVLAPSQGNVESMQQRITRLENLVVSLISDKQARQDSSSVQTSSQEGNHSSPASSDGVAEVIDSVKSRKEEKDITGIEPDEIEANRIVNLYREELSLESPFVIIPSGTTAQDLRRKLPILYRAIMMAASSSYPSRQALYEKEIAEFVSEHLLVRSHKSLELLQAILLFITWYRRNSMGAPQQNSLLHLAESLVFDLNFTRTQTWLDKCFNALATPCSQTMSYGPQTMDERRALLGCFYLSSAAANSFHRPDSMRFTKIIEESCQVLIDLAQYPTDIQLGYIVKLQHLTDRIAQTIPPNENKSLPRKSPLEIHIKAFQDEISEVRASLPPSLKDNTSVLLHLDFATIRLYEFALLKREEAASLTADPTRLENLYNLLLAAKSIITKFLTTPCTNYLSHSYIVWAQFTYSTCMLSRLTFFTSPSCSSWNVNFVRSVIDLSEVLETFANRFEQAREKISSEMHAANGELREEQDDFYGRFIKHTRRAKLAFDHKANSMNGDGKDLEEQRPISPQNVETDSRDFGNVANNLGIDDEMDFDPSIFEGLNDDSFWLGLAGECGAGLGFCDEEFVNGNM